jgi:ABC-type multidrug transport system permease subunit
MRWLLIKDLQILRRSPFLVALLVLYPVVVAVLIGLALSRGPERPKVAFVNEVPARERLEIGGQRLALLSTKAEVYDRIDPVTARSRAQAIDKVRSGEALGAVVVPSDAVRTLESGFGRPTVDVFVNQEDPLKGRLVDDTITSILASANQRLSRAFIRVLLRYEGLLLHGGPVSVFGQRFQVLGLESVERIAKQARSDLPPGSRRNEQLAEVERFARLARENLDITGDVLNAVAAPIAAVKHVVRGSKLPFSSFAAAVAVAVSLMFVTVVLAAASLALEHTENVFARLVRGPVTRGRLLAEKLVLAAACSVAVTLLMLLGLGIFIPLEWGRFALWLVALAAGAAAFAAMGVAIGGLARDVAAASLLAFALLLPVTFLALVPSGVVGAAVYDASRAISALFPFRATLDAMSSALYRKGGMLEPLLHLAALAAAFSIGGRLALRRLG